MSVFFRAGLVPGLALQIPDLRLGLAIVQPCPGRFAALAGMGSACAARPRQPQENFPAFAVAVLLLP